MMTRKDRLNLNLPAEVIDQAKALADERGSSLSLVVERLLVKWIEEGGVMPAKPKTRAMQDLPTTTAAAPAKAARARKAK